MISDDERREVARTIRHAWVNVPDRDPVRHHLRVLCAIYEAVGISDGESDAIDLFDRLADLIEPSKPEGTCGNCRHFIKDRFMPCAAAHGYTEADVSACEDFSPLSCDRDALLEIVQAMDSRGKCASEENGGDGEVDAWWLRQYAHLIRETLGVDDDW